MLNAWVRDFVDLLTAHGGWAGPLFGLLAFGESLAIVGTIIPATPFLFMVGLMLGEGRLDPAALLPWAFAGAIGGYGVSWAGGRKLGHSIYRHALLRNQRRAIARTRLFFRRWGGPALIFGRYVLGPFQSMLPLVAGVAKMPSRTFIAWNMASGLIWVIVVLAPGYFAARGISLFGLSAAYAAQITDLLVVASVGLALSAVAVVAMRAAISRGCPSRR